MLLSLGVYRPEYQVTTDFLYITRPHDTDYTLTGQAITPLMAAQDMLHLDLKSFK